LRLRNWKTQNTPVGKKAPKIRRGLGQLRDASGRGAREASIGTVGRTGKRKRSHRESISEKEGRLQGRPHIRYRQMLHRIQPHRRLAPVAKRSNEIEKTALR